MRTGPQAPVAAVRARVFQITAALALRAARIASKSPGGKP